MTKICNCDADLQKRRKKLM